MRSEIEVFCSNIALLRRHFRLTQKEMSKALEIGVYSIRKMEHGTMPENLPFDIVYWVYRRFGVPYSKQFSGDLTEEDLLACKFDPSAV